MKVIKTTGEIEEFNREKIIRTCLRAGATRELAERIVREVERKSYDGIPTRKILRMIIKLLKKELPHVAARYDLKGSIFRLGPAGFTFEQYVSEILKEYGYSTKTNSIIRGASVKHEIDIVASKKGKKYMIECKYHNMPGIYTGLKVALYTYARFLDLRDGWKRGLSQQFNQAWLICNTKFSEDAIQYANRKRLRLIGWKCPSNHSLEIMIEEKKLYPITILRSLDRRSQDKLASVGLILAIDLIRKDMRELNQMTGIGIKKLNILVEEAKKICC